MIWILLLVVSGMAALSLLLVWRLKEDAEYESTRRHRERWWDF
jgi:hypothetical protein